MTELIHSLFSSVWSVILIVLFFGGSIFVHELGHFLAARHRGLKVERFSIGFGPRIFGWTRDGVEYRVSWIPLGGYVALPQLADMRGIEGDPTDEAEQLPPISYSSKVIVAVMGAVFNVLFAFVLATVLWAIKQPVDAAQTTTKIGYVVAMVDIPVDGGGRRSVPSPAAEADLRIGDVIKSIDGRTIVDWNDVTHAVITGKQRGEDGRREAVFVIEREGVTLERTLHPRLDGEENMRRVGIAADFDVIVHEVPAGSVAQAAGVKPEDRLVAVHGVPIRNHQTYYEVLDATAEQSVELVVMRAGEQVTLTVPPHPAPEILEVYQDSIAHEVGLKAKDRIATVDGKVYPTPRALIRTLEQAREVPHTLSVMRSGAAVEVVVPRRDATGLIGFRFGYGLGESLASESSWVRVDPFSQCWNVITQTFYTFTSLLDPRSDVGIRDMSGPLGISNVYYRAAKENIRFVLWVTILVNLNLAIFNLMPIPVLDGGHILFATIARIRGRAIPAHLLITTQSVFMVLLLSMVLYVTVFDAKRIWTDVSQPTPVAVEPETPAPAAP